MGFGRCLLCLAIAALAAPVSATPIMFTGEINPDGRPLGTSAADATSAEAIAAGLSMQAIQASQLDLLGTYGLEVTANLSMGFGAGSVPNPLTAVSDWTLTNNGASAGYVSLVIASFSPTPMEANGIPTVFDYEFATAGLEIDGFADPNNPQDMVWSFFEVTRTDPQALPVYLMAVDLGLVGAGESVSFDMPYYLEQPQGFLDGSGFTVVLPTLELMTVFTVVPEPTTGLMLGLGIGGLAIAGRRRGRE